MLILYGSRSSRLFFIEIENKLELDFQRFIFKELVIAVFTPKTGMKETIPMYGEMPAEELT